jgi:hypothetical protein
MIINDKKELAAYLNTCDELRELRSTEHGDDVSGGEGEWPEFRKEIVKLCFDKKYLKEALGIEPPPTFGQDWGSWLKKHLAEIEDEAISIVM